MQLHQIETHLVVARGLQCSSGDASAGRGWSAGFAGFPSLSRSRALLLLILGGSGGSDAVLFILGGQRIRKHRLWLSWPARKGVDETSQLDGFVMGSWESQSSIA